MLKIGDKVMCIRAYGPVPRGQIGIIKVIGRDVRSSLGVIFYNFTDGHNLSLPGESSEGGYWIPRDYVKKLGSKPLKKLTKKVMRITFAEYQQFAHVGDIIRTNGDSRTGTTELVSEGIVELIDKNDLTLKVKKPVSCSGWFIDFRNTNAWVEVITSKAPAVKKPSTETREMIIALEKNRGIFSINLRVPEEVEEYYKTLSAGEVQESNVWFDKKKAGIKFYKLKSEVTDAERRIDSYVFSNFGSGIIDGDRINTAMLRTVGASKGVKISSKQFQTMNNADLEYYIKRLPVFVKTLWERSISSRKITAKITYEI